MTTNGKGSRPRPANLRLYRQNYDGIDWKRGPRSAGAIFREWKRQNGCVDAFTDLPPQLRRLVGQSTD